MQPPRPFRGASYDKDMFTYLPAPSNRNVLVESPRKRKSMASDHQIPTPFPNMGYVPQERLNPHENTDDLRGKELPNFGPASSSRKSSKLSNYSDSVMCGHQNEAGASWHLNEREFYDSRSEWHGYNSFHGPSQSSNYNDLPPSFQTSAGLTYEPTSWSPSVTKDFNQRESHDSNSPIGGVKDFHFPKSRSSGLQNSTSMKVEGSDSNELLCGESQNLHHNFIKPVASVVGSDERGCREPKYKVETSSNIQGFGDSSSIAAVDSTKLLGNNGSSSIYSLHEANNIIQQALRLLSAASSTGLFVNRGGSSEARADDSTTAPNSHSQSVSDFLNQRTHSKGSEAGHNLDKPIIDCDKSSVNIGDGLKTENGGSVDAERLWDGTLQLSSTVVVSAIAFFKSGERMPDFSWCGSMEVKGKVRLEAFEKYVQDLPRARSRGLMVMSLRCKEGSSPAGVKEMAEVARKYREGKKVGFAQLNKGVDMYVCPHSDTIITILAKHGFFKGMSVVTEKSDPLLGCVVWRKNSTFGPTTTATPMITAPPSGDGNAEKLQTETGVQKNGAGNKSPEISASPRVTLHEDSIIIPQNKSLTGHVDMAKPNVSVPPVSEPSTVLSDDEDLPEYDFGAPTSRTVCSVLKLEQFRDSYDLPSITPQLRSENSTVCPNPSIQPHQENYTGDGVTSTGPSNQGLFPEKLGNLPETKIPNWAPVEGKKTVDDYHGDSTKNQKNLFDDDMPEWCPPEFEQIKPEVNERVGSFAQRNSMSLGSSFTDLATGRQLPPPPLPPLPPPLPPPGPPLTQQMKLSLPPPPPPLPPGPPPLPTPQGQFSDKNDPSKYYPPPGQLPPPPPLPPGPPPRSPLTLHFSDNDYPTAHSFPKAAVNNFMQSRQDAPSTNVQFQNQHYPSLPHPPPPVPEKTFDNSLMHVSAAGRPIGDGSRHEFSRSSTSNPVQKPKFHQSGMNNRPYQSGWRNSRR